MPLQNPSTVSFTLAEFTYNQNGKPVVNVETEKNYTLEWLVTFTPASQGQDVYYLNGTEYTRVLTSRLMASSVPIPRPSSALPASVPSFVITTESIQIPQATITSITSVTLHLFLPSVCVFSRVQPQPQQTQRTDVLHSQCLLCRVLCACVSPPRPPAHPSPSKCLRMQTIGRALPSMSLSATCTAGTSPRVFALQARCWQMQDAPPQSHRRSVRGVDMHAYPVLPRACSSSSSS